MPSDATGLAGRRVLSISIGYDFAAEVVAGLADLGAEFVRLGARMDTSSRASVAAAIGQAIANFGAPDLVVLSIVPQAAMRPAQIAEMAEDTWREAAMEGLRTTLRVLQGLAPHLKANGGAVVFVAPSSSLVGTPAMIALTTLLEGQRGLMKSVARQWGASGVTLNWVAVAPRAAAPFEGVRLAAKPDAVSVALGRAPALREEIAPVLGFLSSAAGRSITGATLILDGGEWMAP